MKQKTLCEQKAQLTIKKSGCCVYDASDNVQAAGALGSAGNDASGNGEDAETSGHARNRKKRALVEGGVGGKGGGGATEAVVNVKFNSDARFVKLMMSHPWNIRAKLDHSGPNIMS